MQKDNPEKSPAGSGIRSSPQNYRCKAHLLPFYPSGGAAIIGFFLGGFVGWLTAVFFVANDLPMREEVVYGPIKLAAMHSSDGPSGSFVWGSGSFNNRTYYNFLKIMEDGSMVPGSVPADGRVYTIEDPNLKDTGFWRRTFVAVDKTSPLYNWAIGTSERTYILREEFRVPVGTVVQQFKID